MLIRKTSVLIFSIEFLHPVLGLLSLAIMMFIVFQAVLHGQRLLWMVLKASSAGWVK